MTRHTLFPLVSLSVVGLAAGLAALALGAPTASAEGSRVACMAAHRASISPHCRSVFAARPLVREARRRRSRTGWRPVIPPFDQAEAEAEVHEIAPYRTYPYYPLFPDVAPVPYGW